MYGSERAVGAIARQFNHFAGSCHEPGDLYHGLMYWRDYEAFASLFGVTAREREVQRLGSSSPIPLFGVWVVGDAKFLKY